MTRSLSLHPTALLPSSHLPEAFRPDPIVAALRSRSASRLAAPALLLTALALIPAGPAQAAPTFTASDISTTADDASSVFSTDLDGDGDVDVLSASFNDDKIAWYENNGAAVPGFTLHTISTMADFATSVHAADLDGDGDVDVLSSSGNDDKIAWYENDGLQNFSLRTISSTADLAFSVYAADLDGDGDVDVLSASRRDDKIAWYENDGLANFTLRTITTTADNARSVFATDLDGDGDVDVLSASFNDDKIAWYENDGLANFTLRTISTTADGAFSVYAADLDGDGDVDVLSASYFEDKIAWYENDGSQNFTLRTISTTADAAYSVHAADLDGDGDVDVLSASFGDDSITAYYNQPPPDTTPNAFSFPSRTNVERSSVQISDFTQITGMNTPTTISVSAGSSYEINSDGVFRTEPSTISNGDQVRVAHFASPAFATSVVTTLSIGGVDGTFTSTTRAADTTPNAFVFMDQTNVPRNSVRRSNTITITGLTAPAPISIMGGGYSIGCTGTFTATASTIANGQTVCVAHTSAATFNSGVNTVLTVGGVSDTFTSVTAPNGVAALLGVTFRVIGAAVGTVLGLLAGLVGG